MTPGPDPYIVTPDGSADAHGVQRNLEDIYKRLIDTGGRQLKIRLGTSSATFTAATFTPQVTVAHGLGKVPVAVAIFARQPGNIRTVFLEDAAADATNFVYRAYTSDSSNQTGTQNTYWVAFG